MAFMDQAPLNAGASPAASHHTSQALTPPSPLADSKLVYRRYASLFFVCGIGSSDNELITLEVIHRYVEVLDRYFGNVAELDLIFNFQKAYAILDELIIAGEMQESSKKSVLRAVSPPFLLLVTQAQQGVCVCGGLMGRLA